MAGICRRGTRPQSLFSRECYHSPQLLKAKYTKCRTGLQNWITKSSQKHQQISSHPSFESFRTTYSRSSALHYFVHPTHSPVLEPNFDLPLTTLQRRVPSLTQVA